MSEEARVEPYTATLFRATVKLSAATDTCYIVASDMEDAVDQIRISYKDMNVIYVESVQRLSGTIYVTDEARGTLL